MPFPPKGLKAMEHPLKHRFDYSFGLSGASEGMNSAWVTLVRHSTIATQANVKTILVNPSNASQDLETGPLCTKHSIIQNLNLTISCQKSTVNNANQSFKLSWTPFFASFQEKYLVADEDTGVTVEDVMQLTSAAAEEDVVPLSTNKLPVDGNSDKSQPFSSVNFAEVFDTHYAMTTNGTMEDTPFDREVFFSLLSHGTNNVKGALKACLGKTRHHIFTTGSTPANVGRIKTWHIKKFVPRAVRRILPFSFFGILFHVPIETDIDSFYQDTAITASKSNIGIRVLVRYDEWNELHDNTM